jgi:Ni,Fe-hydrogenase maturation factor
MWLVIGYGNSLYSDDGFGIAVAVAMRAQVKDDNVSILACQTLNLELIDDIARADGVIFVDITTELKPGEWQCTDLCSGQTTDDQSSTDTNAQLRDDSSKPITSGNALFTHHTEPNLLIEAAGALYGNAPNSWLYTVGGKDFSLGEKLSSEVRCMVPLIIQLIRQRIDLEST